MGNSVSLRLFGVERAVYGNPELLANHLLEPTAGSGATEAEDITTLALGFRFALGRAVPTAREELAALIRGTDAEQWEQVVTEVEAHYRQFAPHRFGEAGFVTEQVERALTRERMQSGEPAPDRAIVEGKGGWRRPGEIREAL